MSLEELNNRSEFDPKTGSRGYTDKNTNHSYLSLYQELLSPIKDRVKNVLEVGVLEGGSILLWHDFFTNATVYGLDILDNFKLPELRTSDRVVLKLNHNAYDAKYVKETFIDKDIKFDFMLDDGPHTLQSMVDFIRIYLPLLKDDGIFVIEDVPNVNWFSRLKQETPEPFKQYIKIHDRRKIKNRGDDMVFVINKSQTTSK